MHDTPWSDGVPGVTQRHILPGNSYTYHWRATQYGSYWYHAHQQGQLEDGMYGAILIHPKKSLKTPFSLITSDEKSLRAIERAVRRPEPLMVSDFRHATSLEVLEFEHQANMELPCYESILFNGKGSVECLPPDELYGLLSASQKSILQQNNATNFTPKGCMPPIILANTVSKGIKTNVEAIPPKLMDVCEPSQGERAVIEVTKPAGEKDEEKWVAIDVIATFSFVSGIFSIDSLPMIIYAVDAEYIVPQLVQAFPMHSGDRFSILVKLDAAGDFPMRFASTSNTQIMANYATLRYRVEGDDKTPLAQPTPFIKSNGTPMTPATVFWSQKGQKQLNPPELVPAKADDTHKLFMRVTGASYEWAMNSSQFPAGRIDHGQEEVTLFHPEPYKQDNVTFTTLNNTWVDLIIMTATLPMPPHPIHKHGNKMWLIGSGFGAFNWSTVDEAVLASPASFNLVDPPRRDSFVTAQATPTNATWTVLRYHVTSPGAWLLHCHTVSHLLGGMSIVLQDGIDHWPEVPEDYLNYH